MFLARKAQVVSRLQDVYQIIKKLTETKIDIIPIRINDIFAKNVHYRKNKFIDIPCNGTVTLII